MGVLVTDRKYPNRFEPYSSVVDTADGTITYENLETEAELIDAYDGQDIVLTFKAPMTRRVLEAIDGVDLVLRIGTGVDTIDLKAATEHGIVVANAPGYSTQDVATHAIALLLAAAREVAYADRDLRNANGWGERNAVKRTHGGTFGIVGLGRIGRAAIPKARGLGMDIVAYDPYVPEDVFDLLGVEKVGFDELLRRSDGVSIHAPLTAETARLFSTPEFEAMREDAVLVNTARGPIVDEEALVRAVETGEIRSAGIDVFETEPPEETPALRCDRIVCSPHHGGKTPESEVECVEAVCAELERALRREHLENVINEEVLAYGDELASPEL